MAYIRNKFKEESLTKKTERGMTSTIQRGEVLVNGILDNKEYFNTLLSCQKAIAEIKEQFISKLNSTSRIRTFVESSVDGIIPTSGEGYVVSDSVGNVQKMVSRLEFSRNNFSSDIIKGWTNEKREKQFKRGGISHKLNHNACYSLPLSTSLTHSFYLSHLLSLMS